MLKSHSASQCLEIEGGVAQSGARLRVASCNGSPQQLWTYDETTGRIRSAQDANYCVDNNGQHRNGGRLDLQACTSGVDMQQAFDVDGWYMRHRNSPVHTIDLGDSGRIGNLALPWPRQPEMARSLLITHAEPQASRMC